MWGIKLKAIRQINRIRSSIKESILPVIRTLGCYINLKYLVLHEVSVSIA